MSESKEFTGTVAWEWKDTRVIGSCIQKMAMDQAESANLPCGEPNKRTKKKWILQILS